MNRPLRIALLHRENAESVRVWSGTPFFAKRAFEKYVGEVVDLSVAPVRGLLYRVASKLLRLIGKGAPHDNFVGYARRIGRYFSKKLEGHEFDLIFVPGGKETVAYLETDIPIITYSDATWDVVHNYYGVYSNMVPFLARNAEMMEQRMVDKTALFLYASDWARNSAVEHYGADPANVRTVFIGANLMGEIERSAVLPRSLAKPPLRLLLVGVNWHVKGGSVALEVLKRLLERGVDAELTVVGCTAPPGVSHPKMRVIPFLNKQVPEERERFDRAWLEADLFILPSRWEAAGLVFCEASAHGLPILAARTGGIPSIVQEGKNGYTIPHEEEPEGYVRKIMEYLEHPDRYAELCESSRREYEERLNWDAWGKRVATAIAERFPEFREAIERRIEEADARPPGVV